MAYKVGEGYVEVVLRDVSAAEEERWRRETETGLGKKPAKIPVTLRDPVDAAFRARLNSELQATAKQLAQLPITPDTERFRRLVAADITAVEKTLKADIPLDVADAAKWRAEVAAQAEAVSRTVEARIPVEIDLDQRAQQRATGSLRAWAVGAGAIVGPAGAIGAALLGTTGLVAGLGVAAVKGDQTVTDAFAHMRDSVVADTKRLAQPLVPVLTQLAHQTETTFQSVESDIGRAMRAVAPEVEDLTSGVLRLAQNALPGMTRAVQAASPITRTLSADMGDLGRSVGGFVTGLSSGAGGAAAGLHALLSDVDAILPPLGRFIGSLSTVTGQVLTNLEPAFSAAGHVIDGVAFALDHTSGILGPLGTSVLAVYAGWKAWGGVVKIAGDVDKAVTGITEGVKGLRAATNAAEGAIGGVTASVSTMSLATGGVILLLAGLALAFEKARQREKSFGDQAKDVASQMLQGGRAFDQGTVKLNALGDALNLNVTLASKKAKDAQIDMAGALGLAGGKADQAAHSTSSMADTLGLLDEDGQKAQSRIAGISSELDINAGSSKQVSKAIADVKSSLDDQLDAMHATPRAIDLINSSFDAYVESAQKHGAASDQAKTALDILQGQINKATDQARGLNAAEGDTSGLDAAASATDQLDQELRKVINSSAILTQGLQRQQAVEDAFAADIQLRQAIDATTQAQKAYTDAIKQHGARSQEAKQAGDQLLQSMEGQARAAQAAAQANYQGTDAEGRAKAGADAYRQTLVNLSQHASGPLRQALLDTIAKLDQAAKPRTTDLYADISNAEAGIAKAKAQLASVPANKRAKLLADIADLQHKVAVANHTLESLHSKTVGIDVNIITHGNEIVVGLLGHGPHAMAAGGIVKAVRGGVAAQIGEAGTDEGVIPLDARGAQFVGRALAPYVSDIVRGAAGGQPSASAAPAETGGVHNYYVTVNVSADRLSSMQQIVDLFERLPQVARAGGVM